MKPKYCLDRQSTLENCLRDTSLIVIDECGTCGGAELHKFLRENKFLPSILCGCGGCSQKEYKWDDLLEILKRIFQLLGEEGIASFLGKFSDYAELYDHVGSKMRWL